MPNHFSLMNTQAWMHFPLNVFALSICLVNCEMEFHLGSSFVVCVIFTNASTKGVALDLFPLGIRFYKKQVVLNEDSFYVSLA